MQGQAHRASERGVHRVLASHSPSAAYAFVRRGPDGSLARARYAKLELYKQDCLFLALFGYRWLGTGFRSVSQLDRLADTAEFLIFFIDNA